MIQKPTGYDQAEAYTGEYERLELGGHVCVIKTARQENDRNGNPWLVICFDIAPGDAQAGYFARQFEARKKQNPDAKWPVGGIYRQGLQDSSASYLKGLMTCIAESNPGFVWNWDETTLAGKRFGGVFGEEEYKNQDGEIKLATKCRYIRSVQTIQNGVDVPAIRTLRDRSNTRSTTPTTPSSPAQTYMVEVDEDLPF